MKHTMTFPNPLLEVDLQWNGHRSLLACLQRTDASLFAEQKGPDISLFCNLRYFLSSNFSAKFYMRALISSDLGTYMCICCVWGFFVVFYFKHKAKSCEKLKKKLNNCKLFSLCKSASSFSRPTYNLIRSTQIYGYSSKLRKKLRIYFMHISASSPPPPSFISCTFPQKISIFKQS